MYKNADDLPIVFGPAELAIILGVSKNTAYRLVNKPDFPKFRAGRKIIISKKQFIEWMDTHFSCDSL